MAIGRHVYYNGGMSNSSPAAEAEPKDSRRTKFLPAAIGAVAVLGGFITYVIAAPGQAPTGPPQLGKPVPQFELQTTGGGTWKLSDHKGREVLLVFFRTHT